MISILEAPSHTIYWAYHHTFNYVGFIYLVMNPINLVMNHVRMCGGRDP